MARAMRAHTTFWADYKAVKVRATCRKITGGMGGREMPGEWAVIPKSILVFCNGSLRGALQRRTRGGEQDKNWTLEGGRAEGKQEGCKPHSCGTR